MNKVLLVNPRLTRRPVRFNIPVGLIYLGTELSQHGYDVNIVDANNTDNYGEFVPQVVKQAEGCLAVGFSVMTAQIASGLEMSVAIKDAHPDVPIIWGGVHPTLYPEQVASNEVVDYVVKGEGEDIAVGLLRRIQDGVPSEAICEGNGLFNIDSWQYPQWKLFDDVRRIGVNKMAELSGVGMPLVESRHCPHRCSFCINPVVGGKYRFRPARLVVDDILKAIESGVHSISFYDEDFFANKKRLVEILDAIEQWHLKFQWFGTARADYFRETHINGSLLKRIKDSGCVHLGIGAESGSQRILDMLKKDITVEDTIHAAELLNKVGINADFSFMIGLPGERYDDMQETVKLVGRVTKINQSFRILGPFIYRPYPGSELYQQCLQYGLEEPEMLEEWADSPYIDDTVSPSDYILYPWVRYSLGKVQRMIFYCWLAGMRVRSRLLTRIVRAVGQWRCRRLFWRLPVEVVLWRVVRAVGFDRKMSRGKF